MVISSLLFLGIALSSIYVFQSGMPQPADFILLHASAFIFFKVMVVKPIIKVSSINLPIVLLWLFVLYAFIVASYWTLYYSDPQFFRHVSYYFYNAMLTTSLVIYCLSNENYKKVLLNSLYCALIISGLGVLLNVGGAPRETGFFNNPNQLAFYSLLVWCCILTLTNAKLKVSPFYWMAFLSAVLGILSAASIGAMAGLIILLVIMIFKNLSPLRIIKYSAYTATIALCVAFYFNDVVVDTFNNVQVRMLRVDAKIDDMYGERNYDRITAFPSYLIFGAGEGLPERFHPYGNNEIHSTPGTLIFSYGLLGVIFVAGAWLIVLLRSPLYLTFIALAPMIYSLTHMGLRTSMFWVLFALIWLQIPPKTN